MTEEKIVIDISKGEALWDGLSPEGQVKMMEAMFLPLLESGKKMKAALEEIVHQCEQSGSRPTIAAIARDALPK